MRGCWPGLWLARTLRGARQAGGSRGCGVGRSNCQVGCVPTAPDRGHGHPCTRQPPSSPPCRLIIPIPCSRVKTGGARVFTAARGCARLVPALAGAAAVCASGAQGPAARVPAAAWGADMAQVGGCSNKDGFERGGKGGCCDECSGGCVARRELSCLEGMNDVRV